MKIHDIKVRFRYRSGIKMEKRGIKMWKNGRPTMLGQLIVINKPILLVNLVHKLMRCSKRWKSKLFYLLRGQVNHTAIQSFIKTKRN
jgi:hypothetical protein